MKKLCILILEIRSPLRVSIIFLSPVFLSCPNHELLGSAGNDSVLPCAKISPAERTGSNDHCVALICVSLSYCCKNIPLPIQWLKYPFLLVFKLHDSTSRPEWLAPLPQFIQSNSNWLLAGLLWRTLRSSCCHTDSNGKQNPTSWNWKAVPFPRFQQGKVLFFTDLSPSLHAPLFLGGSNCL